MNLISCNSCGGVLDKDKLNFAADIYMDSGAIDSSKAAWNGYDYVPFVDCPVCNSVVLGEIK